MSNESFDRSLAKLDRAIWWLGIAVCVYAGVVLGSIIWRVFFR